MTIDIPSVIIALGCTAIVQGLLLLALWRRDRGARLLAHCAAAVICFGAGIVLAGGLRLFSPLVDSAVGGALMCLSGLLFISAARRLSRRRTPLAFAVIVPSIWLASVAFWPPFQDAGARILALCGMMAGSFLLSAIECWRADPSGAARWPLTITGLLFSGIFSLCAFWGQDLTGLRLMLTLSAGSVPDLLILFASPVLLVAALFAFGLSHERSQAKRLQMALADSATGALRRGTFMTQGGRVVVSRYRNGQQICLVLVSVAHDPHRDAALLALAREAAGMLKPTDMLARMRAHEIACLLVNVTLDEATVFAGRLLAKLGDEQAEACSGVASSTQMGPDLRGVLQAADMAMQSARASRRSVVPYHPALSRAYRHSDRRPMKRAA